MASFGAAVKVLVSALVNKESALTDSIHRTLGASNQFILQLKDAETSFQSQGRWAHKGTI